MSYTFTGQFTFLKYNINIKFNLHVSLYQSKNLKKMITQKIERRSTVGRSHSKNQCMNCSSFLSPRETQYRWNYSL